MSVCSTPCHLSLYGSRLSILKWTCFDLSLQWLLHFLQLICSDFKSGFLTLFQICFEVFPDYGHTCEEKEEFTVNVVVNTLVSVTAQ